MDGDAKKLSILIRIISEAKGPNYTAAMVAIVHFIESNPIGVIYALVGEIARTNFGATYTIFVLNIITKCYTLTVGRDGDLPLSDLSSEDITKELLDNCINRFADENEAVRNTAAKTFYTIARFSINIWPEFDLLNKLVELLTNGDENQIISAAILASWFLPEFNLHESEHLILSALIDLLSKYDSNENIMRAVIIALATSTEYLLKSDPEICVQVIQTAVQGITNPSLKQPSYVFIRELIENKPDIIFEIAEPLLTVTAEDLSSDETTKEVVLAACYTWEIIFGALGKFGTEDENAEAFVGDIIENLLPILLDRAEYDGTDTMLVLNEWEPYNAARSCVRKLMESFFDLTLPYVNERIDAYTDGSDQVRETAAYMLLLVCEHCGSLSADDLETIASAVLTIVTDDSAPRVVFLGLVGLRVLLIKGAISESLAELLPLLGSYATDPTVARPALGVLKGIAMAPDFDAFDAYVQTLEAIADATRQDFDEFVKCLDVVERDEKLLQLFCPFLLELLQRALEEDRTDDAGRLCAKLSALLQRMPGLLAFFGDFSAVLVELGRQNVTPALSALALFVVQDATLAEAYFAELSEMAFATAERAGGADFYAQTAVTLLAVNAPDGADLAPHISLLLDSLRDAKDASQLANTVELLSMAVVAGLDEQFADEVDAALAELVDPQRLNIRLSGFFDDRSAVLIALGKLAGALSAHGERGGAAAAAVAGTVLRAQPTMKIVEDMLQMLRESKNPALDEAIEEIVEAIEEEEEDA